MPGRGVGGKKSSAIPNFSGDGGGSADGRKCGGSGAETLQLREHCRASDGALAVFLRAPGAGTAGRASHPLPSPASLSLLVAPDAMGKNRWQALRKALDVLCCLNASWYVQSAGWRRSTLCMITQSGCKRT
eukprot:274950-Pelagomonas_calceolata.AAC.1